MALFSYLLGSIATKCLKLPVNIQGLSFGVFFCFVLFFSSHDERDFAVKC